MKRRSLTDRRQRVCRQRRVKVILMFLSFWISLEAAGINAHIEGKVDVTVKNESMAELVVNVSWEGAWCDEVNWDAVWLFLKYRTSSSSGYSDEAWRPVWLTSSGHRVSEGYYWLPGRVTFGVEASSLAGVFVQRSLAGSGRSEVRCTLQWKYTDCGFSEADLRSGRVLFMAQAVEMVYIPGGSYYAGASVGVRSFSGPDGTPVEMAEYKESVTLYIRDSLAPDHTLARVVVPASYPRGNKGFYVMKYELSQEQYVVFFNSLSPVEQRKLLDVSGLQAGDFVFGKERQEPSHRNYIVLASKEEIAPAVLRNGYFVMDTLSGGLRSDGRTLACNYMSLADLLAYCSWSGLRPMSELEYEKSSRRPYPALPLPGEYAWNRNDSLEYVSGLDAAGSLAEQPVAGKGNANYISGLLDGPVRCGSLGINRRGAWKSGGSYWNVMELSGNVRELCRAVGNSSVFSATVHGEGVFNPLLWDTLGSNYGYRGGGFGDVAGRLRTDDRALMSAVAGFSCRLPSSGFRGVRSFEIGGDLKLSAGVIEIEGEAEICPGSEVHIISREGAKVENGMDVPFRYRWYVNDTLLVGVNGEELRWQGFVRLGAGYKIRREAWCVYGSVAAELNVQVRRPQPFPGMIECKQQNVCPGGDVWIDNKQGARVDCGLEIEYRWYVNGRDAASRLAEAHDSILVFRNMLPGRSYTFRRSASCLSGEVFTDSVTVRSISPAMDGGEIAVEMPVCPNDGAKVRNVRSGVSECGLPIVRYRWFFSRDGGREQELTEEHDSVLFFREELFPGHTYTFRREAVSLYSSGSAVSEGVYMNFPDLSAGRIVAATSTVCAGDNVLINNEEEGAAACGLAHRYVWKADEKIVPGADGATLLYSNLRNGDSCAFVRGIATIYDTVWSNTVKVLPVDPQLNAGKIKVADGITKACLGDSVEIVNVEGASLICGQVTYRWRIDDEVIPGAHGTTLKYKITNANRSYLFIRDASYDGGRTWPVSAKLPAALQGATKTDFTINPASGVLTECVPELSFSVTDNWGQAVIRWKYETGGRTYLDASGYSCKVTRESVNVGNGVGTGNQPRYVTISYSRDGCRSEKRIPVTVEAWEVMKCVSAQETYFIDCRDGKRYPMRRMADGKCWMTRNLAYNNKSGKVSTADLVLGGYYYSSGLLKPEKPEICPEGWHTPTRSEWEGLMDSYGGQTVAGEALKGTYRWTKVKCPGTNSSGFNAIPWGSSTNKNHTDFAKWWVADGKTGFTLKNTTCGVSFGKADVYYNIRCVRDLRPDEVTLP